MTSEERREVADKLREISDAHDDTEAIRVVRALGLEYKVYVTTVGFSSVAVRRLADLIDPTCGFVECPDNDEFALRVVSGYMCLNCEHETIVKRTAGGWADPPRYCSYCGERLVSDDE